MKTVCELNQCTGCMACIDICTKDAINIQDNLSAYNAVIDPNKCIDCNACHSVCQNNYPIEGVAPNEWYQGWAIDTDLRKRSSSGGLATAISEAFVSNGGVVCSCTFKGGEFIFEFAKNTAELKKFVGSKYVKSNPIGAYKQIRERLKSEKKVLFIGLPCQVAALRKYIGKGLAENLYTIDLICHGTPSPKLLEIFLKQYKISLYDLQDIQFRKKAKFQVYGDYKGIITNGVSDRYSIAFLNSLIYTENCYNCQYARKERVSDLTIGDSWGSKLPEEEHKKGISLVLCQTEKGSALLKNANLCLDTVDLENAIENNHQLRHPSVMPKERDFFFKNISNKSFNLLVLKALPKQSVRQIVKQILIKTHIIRVGGVPRLLHLYFSPK